MMKGVTYSNASASQALMFKTDNNGFFDIVVTNHDNKPADIKIQASAGGIRANIEADLVSPGTLTVAGNQTVAFRNKYPIARESAVFVILPSPTGGHSSGPYEVTGYV